MDLDVKDKKILSALEMNARISDSELAKKVRLSKQVVKYRIERLKNQNIIQGYNAIVDLTKLQQTIYLAYLKLTNISSKNEKSLVQEIEKHKDVLSVGKNAGHWDLSIVMKGKDNQEFDKSFKKIFSGKADKIKEKLITSEIESTYLKTSLIYEGNNKEFSTSDKQQNVKIDEIDKKIISLLSENCQTTLLDLSEKVNLSPNAVKGRIKRLEQEKVIIGYKTKINYDALGFLHFRVFIHLKKYSDELYNSIKSFLREKGNVESVSRYFGYADVDFRCYSKSLEGFYSLISDLKDKFLNEIIEIDSMPIFAWEKIRYYN